MTCAMDEYRSRRLLAEMYRTECIAFLRSICPPTAVRHNFGDYTSGYREGVRKVWRIYYFTVGMMPDCQCDKCVAEKVLDSMEGGE